jgi:hypothetical protein
MTDELKQAVHTVMSDQVDNARMVNMSVTYAVPGDMSIKIKQRLEALGFRIRINFEFGDKAHIKIMC